MKIIRSLGQKLTGKRINNVVSKARMVDNRLPMNVPVCHRYSLRSCIGYLSMDGFGPISCGSAVLNRFANSAVTFPEQRMGAVHV